MLLLSMVLFGLSGCELIPEGVIPSVDKVKLDTPTNLRVEEGTLRWNAVDNASYYIIKIGDDDYQRNTIACDLTNIITVNGVYYITVQAVPSDSTMTASDYSSPYQFTFENGLYVQGNTTEGLFRYFDDINKSESYIGYGYDVINSSYINSDEVKMNYPIFDYEKLLDKRLIMIKERRTEDMYISSDTMEDYMNRLSASFSTKIKAGKIFSGGAMASFTSTNTNVASALFYEYSHQTRAYYLILQLDTEEYKEMLTDAFRRDLMNMNISNLFQKYGTHLITSVAMGGRIDLFYTMTSNKVTDFSKIKASLETDVKFTGGSVDVEGSFSYEDKAVESGVQIQIKSNVYGGNYSQMNTEKAMLKNYDSWINSIEEKPALIGIRDINSLYPIWELLGDSQEEQDRKNDIMEYFNTYSEESYESLLSLYNINAPITPEGVEVVLYSSRTPDVTIDPNDVSQGQLLYYDLIVTPGNAIINTTVTADLNQFIEVNQGNRTIRIAEDTPDGTIIKITFSVGHGVSSTISLKVIRRNEITFDSQGGTQVDTISMIKYNSYVLAPTEPIKEHYTFIGWYTDLSFKTEFVFNESPIISDLHLYAKWEENEYTVTFNANGGSNVDHQTTSILDEFMITEPTDPDKEGYDFSGWYTVDDVLVDIKSAKFEENTTLYAHWNIRLYTVTFVLNNDEVDMVIENVEYDSIIHAPDDISNGDLKLVGWYLDNQLLNAFDFRTDKVRSNLILFAKWQNSTSKISFYTNGGSAVDDIIQVPNTSVIEPNEPTKEGYSFMGWYTVEDELYIFNNMPNEDIMLFAKWQVINAVISFESNGGSSVADITQIPNATINQPVNPTYEGYSFVGWYTIDDILFVFDVMPTSSITLYAKWEANTYHLNVHLDNQTLENVQSVLFGESYIIEQSIPTKEFYVFDGWFVEYQQVEYRITDSVGNAYLSTWSIPQNSSIYPKWSNDPEWNFIFNETDLDYIRLNTGLQYVLMDNITITKTQWIPISDFTGILDGNGFQIFDLTISIPADIYAQEKSFGLFANNSGVLRNITLTNVTINGSIAHGGAWVNVGGLTGTNQGQIINSAVDVNITCKRYLSRIGGLVGYNKGTITDVRSWATIYGNGDMGAVAGVTENGTISHAIAYNRILSLYVQINNRSIGGIVGYSVNSTLEDLSVIGMTIKYAGRSEIEWNEIAPNMGLLVGHLNASTITGYSITDTVFNLGDLSAKTNNGWLLNPWYNQQQNVGNGIDDTYGKSTGTVSVVK